MPLYMNVYYVTGGTARTVAEAHDEYLRTQDLYGVRHLRYWIAEEAGKVFCLVDAPNAEAAATSHLLAYGPGANQIYRVEEGT